MARYDSDDDWQRIQFHTERDADGVVYFLNGDECDGVTVGDALRVLNGLNLRGDSGAPMLFVYLRTDRNHIAASEELMTGSTYTAIGNERDRPPPR